MAFLGQQEIKGHLAAQLAVLRPGLLAIVGQFDFQSFQQTVIRYDKPRAMTK